MPNELEGRRVAFLAADGVEKVELEQPREAVRNAGGQVDLLSLESGEIDARNHDLEPAGTFSVDRVVGDESVDEYDALVIPGGTVNADKLRLDDAAVAFVNGCPRSGIAPDDLVGGVKVADLIFAFVFTFALVLLAAFSVSGCAFP